MAQYPAMPEAPPAHAKPRPTLISFLPGVAKDNHGRWIENGRKLSQYRFRPDGIQSPLCQCFTWPLLGHLAKERFPPSRLVVLGTRGGAWDNLILSLNPPRRLKADSEPIVQELGCKAAANRLCRADIERMLPRLQDALVEYREPWGLPMDLMVEGKLIPDGDDLTQQIAILGAVVDAMEEGADLWLDITHGLRSLPMLGLLAAIMARRIKKATIRGVWYGAYDLVAENQPAPALDLSALLEAVDWTEADRAFDASGAINLFVAPLKRQGTGTEQDNARRAAIISRLESAGRSERLMQIGKAANEALEIVGGAWPEDGLARHFKAMVEEDLAWVAVKNPQGETSLAERFRTEARLKGALALRYVDREDMLRAVVLAFEAIGDAIEAAEESAASHNASVSTGTAHASDAGADRTVDDRKAFARRVKRRAEFHDRAKNDERREALSCLTAVRNKVAHVVELPSGDKDFSFGGKQFQLSRLAEEHDHLADAVKTALRVWKLVPPATDRPTVPR